MDMKKYQISVVIGRFEPAHNAHFALFNKALEISEHLIIVLGSHNSPRTIKNPWTSSERKVMILSGISDENRHRIHFVTTEDTIYSDATWISSTVSEVATKANQIVEFYNLPRARIALVAHNKDETTYYINYFKRTWDIIDADLHNADYNGPALSATKIRELYFEGYINLIEAGCPASVVNFLRGFQKTQEYALLHKEYHDALAYDAQYQNVPYGQTNFVTVDAVVVQSGHVLLVKRGQSPGKGLFALPGGHLNINETFIEGAIRELKEETKLKVPNKVLMGSIFYDHVFDHPDRSLRGRTKKKIGRTITRVFGFKLDDASDLPRVSGADDACEARWVTFGEIKNMRDQLFEDHHDLIIHALNRL